MPNKLSNSSFIKPSDTDQQQLTINEFVKLALAHEGFIIVDNIQYDNILYCGTDNLYFSYCFNFTTGRAITETLLIVDTIHLIAENTFIVVSQQNNHLISFKD